MQQQQLSAGIVQWHMMVWTDAPANAGPWTQHDGPHSVQTAQGASERSPPDHLMKAFVINEVL